MTLYADYESGWQLAAVHFPTIATRYAQAARHLNGAGWNQSEAFRHNEEDQHSRWSGRDRGVVDADVGDRTADDDRIVSGEATDDFTVTPYGLVSGHGVTDVVVESEFLPAWSGFRDTVQTMLGRNADGWRGMSAGVAAAMDAYDDADTEASRQLHALRETQLPLVIPTTEYPGDAIETVDTTNPFVRRPKSEIEARTATSMAHRVDLDTEFDRTPTVTESDLRAKAEAVLDKAMHVADEDLFEIGMSDSAPKTFGLDAEQIDDALREAWDLELDFTRFAVESTERVEAISSQLGAAYSELDSYAGDLDAASNCMDDNWTGEAAVEVTKILTEYQNGVAANHRIILANLAAAYESYMEAWATIRQDVLRIGDNAIEALEALLDDGSADRKVALNATSQALGVMAAVIGVAAAPATGGLSVGLTALSLAATVGSATTSTMAENIDDPTVPIMGGSISDIIFATRSGLNDAMTHIQTLEKALTHSVAEYHDSLSNILATGAGWKTAKGQGLLPEPGLLLIQGSVDSDEFSPASR